MVAQKHKYYKQTEGSAYMKVFSNLIRAVMVTLLVVSSIGVMALLISLVWNAIVPEVFDLPCITYWQAYLFYLLTYMLFFNQRSDFDSAPTSKEVARK